MLFLIQLFDIYVHTKDKISSADCTLGENDHTYSYYKEIKMSNVQSSILKQTVTVQIENMMSFLNSPLVQTV